MDYEYIKISKSRKQDADNILEDSKLIQILEKFGKVSIIGSYKYDLMYGPDIDVIVETDNPRENVLKALASCFESKSFRKLELGDFENFPMDNRPKSYILVLKTNRNGVKWEIEIWFHQTYPSNIYELDKLMQNINDEQRNDVLKIKHQRASVGQSKKDLNSVEIYKGVLVEGKKDLSDF